MSNFSTESSIVHEKDVKIFNVVDDKFLESVGQVISGFLIRTVADFRHGSVTSESTPHSVVDSWINSLITVSSSPAGC